LKLWTIHSMEVWKLLKQQEYYHGVDGLINKLGLCIEAYNWMKNQLALKTGTEKDYYPVWAWVKRPDLRTSGHLSKGEKGILIEFEIDENDVLTSDFELWHYVLNYWYLPSSMEEGDNFKNELKNKGLSIYKQKPLPEPYHTKVVQSWQKIFDLDWFAKGIADKREDKLMQAVFWELKLEQVKKVKEFIAR